jgi:hypothetical protein
MDYPIRPPTISTSRNPLRVTPVVLAGIAGDPELSLAAKGVLLIALSHPIDRLLIRSGLSLTAMRPAGSRRRPGELVETRWLAPLGEGRFTLREDLDGPDQESTP